MGRYYQKVKSYTRKVKTEVEESDCDRDCSKDVECFDVKTDNLKVGW
jgi:hypothetical protein